MIDKLIEWIFAKFKSLPTTEVRIMVSIGIVIWTAYTVNVLDRDPSAAWLGFLAILLGLDVSQYLGKKKVEKS